MSGYPEGSSSIVLLHKHLRASTIWADCKGDSLLTRSRQAALQLAWVEVSSDDSMTSDGGTLHPYAIDVSRSGLPDRGDSNHVCFKPAHEC